jgi:hypothetical protein
MVAVVGELRVGPAAGIDAVAPVARYEVESLERRAARPSPATARRSVRSRTIPILSPRTTACWTSDASQAPVPDPGKMITGRLGQLNNTLYSPDSSSRAQVFANPVHDGPIGRLRQGRKHCESGTFGGTGNPGRKWRPLFVWHCYPLDSGCSAVGSQRRTQPRKVTKRHVWLGTQRKINLFVFFLLCSL